MKTDVKKVLEKLLPLGIGVLAIGQMVLSNKKDTVDRNNMKSEIKADIIKELLENK